ncbi:hypothetical protein [Micromonospora sp. NBC_01796]|uniref:hypothetical protein n=1 Tax=Micromonospora sp. NBC_01796 TaxID=2975987 RepID=UPI002DD84239|nr:hypothetical protein [Micromonospora sp. NBC_01796]WSA84918.1 hypothetical protein OIE47_31910 [Micromonospora sp. NBC_01796]
MHPNDEVKRESTSKAQPIRSAEPPSDDRLTGRHRTPARRNPLRRSTARDGEKSSSRIRSAVASTPVRLTLVTGITCCLGFVAFTESRAATTPTQPLHAALVDTAALADRAAAAEKQAASRAERAPLSPSPTATTPTPTPPAKSKAPTKPPVRKPTKPAKPKPVAGLDQAQMDNAAAIVKVGIKLGIPRQGLIVAIATAMQESNLYNLANPALPESLDYPNQGTGYDYDSVGLFQQRTSSGWGAVADLMRPAYAAQAFFEALLQIPGWQQMSVSGAAQAVQVSAFPDAYAQHESRATTIVAALA